MRRSFYWLLAKRPPKSITLRQLLQTADGGIEVAEVPVPRTGRGCVLVRNSTSLVSAGTERMAVEFAGKSLMEKARARPDLVRQVLEKAWREGVLAAYQAVCSRLDRPGALGYSSAGTVLEIGADIHDLRPGDRVACAGAGYAAHAEVVSVPRNLVAKIPDCATGRGARVDFEEAAFATLGAIALHGLRLAELQMGETVAVIGLGLVGQLAVQLAQVAGCSVFGMDPDRERCRLAEQLGCLGAAVAEEEFLSLLAARTESAGADAVIVAAATPSESPVRLAGEAARSRGRVIAVGAVGTHVPRRLYYEKELDFRISRSYGPGRYDREYEENGRDYPAEYVRWTENRNLKTFLGFLAEGKIRVQPLISHRFSIAEAPRAYDLILGKSGETPLGIVLTYAQAAEAPERALRPVNGESAPAISSEEPRIGLLGAGNFALGVLLPAIRAAEGTRLVGVCSATGLSAMHAARKFGFSYATTDPGRIFNDPGVSTVVIATPHRQHAAQVLATLAGRKNVFCEKPLCLAEDELADILRVWANSEQPAPQLTVGFNRRFAPMALRLKEFLAGQPGRPILHCRVNAGPPPADGWMRDSEEGGRLLGEACHFVDLLSFLTGEIPERVFARTLAGDGPTQDTAAIHLEFSGGSLGTITYASNGDRSFPKERIEAFCGGSAAALDDFRRLELVRNGRRTTIASRWRQDKGHRGEWRAFVAGLKEGRSAISLQAIVSSTLATLRIAESLRRGTPVEVGAELFMRSAQETAGSRASEASPALAHASGGV